jgi:hypothetical protein
MPSAAAIPPTTVPHGPPPLPSPGPQTGSRRECACLADTNNPFLGFIGDAEEKDVLFTTN